MLNAIIVLRFSTTTVHSSETALVIDSLNLGRRNYKYFTMFLYMTSISLLFFGMQAIIFFVYLFKDPAEGTPTWVLIIILVFGIPIGILALTLIGFGIFHCILQAKGRTTREFIKKLPKNEIEAEIESSTRDWMTLSKPYLDFSRKITENDVNIILALN